jgi:hypothetical protein
MLICPAASADDVLRVVCFQYPPNLVVDKLGAAPGAPKGAIARVWIDYIAPMAGVRIQWIGPVPFSRAMKMLEDGSADAIQHLSRTPEREAKFIFSKKPIMWGRSGLLVLKSDSLSGVSGIQQIKDKKIAIIGEGYLPPFIIQNRGVLNIEEVFGDEAGERIVKMVVNRRVWAGYFTFPDVLLYYAASNGMMDKLKVISYPGSEVMEVTYAAMSRKSDPSLIARIDAAVSAVYGSYDYPSLVRDILRQINK